MMKSIMSFEGRVAVVTGAAGGIGRQVVADLGAAGAHVIACDLDENRLYAVYHGNAGVEMVAADVTVAADRAKLLARAQALGPVWHLVNTHGINPMAEIPDVTEPLWERVQSVNASSVFFLCQQFAPHLRDGGSIVNFSSLAGKEAATVACAPYNASKAAVIALTKTFARYLAPRNVRVNCVCPGIIDTPMQDEVIQGLAQTTGRSLDEVKSARAAWSPLGRMGTPTDVSSVVLFLLSDAAAYLTGQAINVTGGTITY